MGPLVVAGRWGFGEVEELPVNHRDQEDQIDEVLWMEV
jgi:hypothetical protein